MKAIEVPYGRGALRAEIPDARFAGVLHTSLDHYAPLLPEADLVREAMENPIDSPRLSDMAQGKNRVVIIASDHTRPVPSRFILPPMLAEIRRGNPAAQITILVATGCHRDMTAEEITAKFGPEIAQKETIVMHNCDTSPCVQLGTLPSGGDLRINRLAVECDLLVAEGFIEPHFFAGYSGGRKSVLPGVADRNTVLYNHNAEFVDCLNARAGVLADNPLHTDMLYAAKAARLAFICNVVLNHEKRIVHAVAGDSEAAHLAGCRFLDGKCKVSRPAPADIVITSNGGYPLDQNIYQAVKGMIGGEACVRQGGVIIMLAEASDGHGGEAFFDTMRGGKSLDQLYQEIMATPKTATSVDQWQSQIFIRVLQKATVLFVSEVDDETVRAMRMIPAHSIEEALRLADEKLGYSDGSILVIPDGVSVIVDDLPG